MFDKRLFKELFKIKGYFIIETAAAIAAVSLTIYEAFLISTLINSVFIEKSSLGMVGNRIIALGIVIVVKVSLNGITEYYNRGISLGIKHDFRNRFMEGIVESGPISIKNEKAGRLATIFDEGIEAFDAFYSEFVPQMFVSAIGVPTILVVVIFRDSLSFSIMFITAPLIPVFMMLIGRMAGYMSSRQWKSLQRMGGHFLDVIKGLTTLKLFGSDESQVRVIEQVSEDFRQTTMSVLRISFLSALVLELVATISTAMLAVTLGVRLMYGKIPFQEALFILLLAPEYYQPLRQLGAKFHAAMGAKASADTVFPIVDMGGDRVNGECEREREHERARVQGELIKDSIEISIKGLCYSYDDKYNALSNIDLELTGGSKVALTGISGGGKSTLVSILMGFIGGYSGSVKINGRELNSMDRDLWSKSFAYVPQHPKLFKGTLLENISISRPEATIGEITKVIEEIGLGELLIELPKGLNTLLGEGGIQLSGGQIQLVAIGRAILKEAPFIILDEPTSALDIDTEKKINKAFVSLFKNRTVITIAHRLSTIKESDYIYVLQEGEIVEQGSHGELTNRGGAYSRLVATGEGL